MTIPTVALADLIDELLPQTQCRQCGYAACRPYAQAIAAGRAEPNCCPPGGDECARAVAALLGREFRAVDPRYGAHKAPAVALIDESRCIGCRLCIEACPVDAIVGAAKHMHTVIAEDCTGCGLCIPPCPVDCILLEPVTAPVSDGARKHAAQRARWHYQRREARLAHRALHAARLASAEIRQITVDRAMERARARLARRSSG